MNHPTPETTVDKTLQPGVATGYVHNVSPIKNGKYFDFQLKMKHKTVRAVCFLHQNGSILVSTVQATLQWK